MIKVSFIVPARNKAAHIEKTALSVLNQSYSPFEIVFSDQGSEDSTLAILKDVAGNYDGPNKVRVLQCPETEYRGMCGLNAHLNWLDMQIEGDLVIMCSADDLNHPDRVKHTVRAFEEFSPSYVNTGVEYIEADGSNPRYTDFPNRADRWVLPEETIRHQIGSSGSSAWARDLYQKHGPLQGCEQQDMILPMMALLERGIYYVDMPLHTYIFHASANNTGFMGQMAAAKDDNDKAGLVELNNFINVLNWTKIFERWMKHPVGNEKMFSDPGTRDAMLEKICNYSHHWAAVREHMITSRIPPQMMKV